MSRTLSAVAVALLVVLAGCSSGTEHVEAEGASARVPADALSETGYERVSAVERTVNATLIVTLQGDVQGRNSVDVTATVPVVTYRRGTDPAAVFAVASSPSVTVVENPEQTADPLSTRSPAALVEFVQSTYANVTGVEQTDTASVTMLGGETAVRTYRATATTDGSSTAILVDIARVAHDGDVVTVVAVRPASGDNPGRSSALFEAVRH